jgi:hypothetical protein
MSHRTETINRGAICGLLIECL